jgi:UDP-2,4-diacetamido-2,4,6-trideoxy-beta-L-altropyranose hydrolase
MKRRVVFRADGNSSIGLGHIYRCLALREILDKEFDYLIICRNINPSLKILFHSFAIDFLSLENQLDTIREIDYIKKIVKKTDLIVLDGYHFSTEYESEIKSAGYKLIAIDDLHSRHFVSDAVINHGPGVIEKNYSKEPFTKLFLGPDYAIIRKRFIEEAKNKREITEINKILVCLGGADPNNFTKKIVAGCLDLENISELHVLVGAAYLHNMDWITALKNIRKVKLHRNLNTDELANIFLKNDLAIVSASTIAFEALSTGIKLICGYYSQDQLEFYNYLTENNIVYGLGNFSSFNYAELNEPINFMKNNLSKYTHPDLIDGNQDIRLKSIFKTLA